MTNWIDLTMDIYPEIPKMSFLPCPEMERISEAGEHSLQVTDVSLTTHIGTHFDAACHAVPGSRSIDQYGLERWITPGVVQDVDAEALSPIGVDQVRPAADALESGDALVLRTGWEDRAADDSYADHPYFSGELCEWLIERDVNWVGMDFLTPDKPPSEREEGFDYPAHTALLGNDVLIAENLTNLGQVDEKRVDLVAMPLRLRGSDGSPARIAAKPRGGA